MYGRLPYWEANSMKRQNVYLPEEIKKMFFEEDVDRVIHWSTLDSFDGKNVYLTSYQIWELPMWTFHFLRKLAMFIDSVANWIRSIIYRYTRTYDISSGFKQKTKKFGVNEYLDNPYDQSTRA